MSAPPPDAVPSGGIAGWLAPLHQVLAALSGVAVGAAACVLTWEVAGRYFLKIPSDWQDELSVFLLIGATFLSAGWVQARRGHVAIEALSAILPPGVESLRARLADLLSFLFCLFFTWKCWTLWHEAWDDGQITSSAWGPPLWIPYGLMAVGMTVLTAQLLLQLLSPPPPVRSAEERAMAGGH